MATVKQVQVRLTAEELAAIERVAPRIKRHAADRVTASDVLRAGLAAIDAQTAPKKSRKTG